MIVPKTYYTFSSISHLFSNLLINKYMHSMRKRGGPPPTRNIGLERDQLRRPDRKKTDKEPHLPEPNQGKGQVYFFIWVYTFVLSFICVGHRNSTFANERRLESRLNWKSCDCNPFSLNVMIKKYLDGHCQTFRTHVAHKLRWWWFLQTFQILHSIPFV